MKDSKESIQKPIIENQFDFAEEFDIGEFKIKLNTFMIENAPAEFTIQQAEAAMMVMIENICDVLNPPSEVME
jgi:hypothetical protein